MIKNRNRSKLFVLLICCCCKNISTAQTTYDIFTYVAPKNYKAEDQTSFKQFSKIDNVKKDYCLLSLYKSQISKGNIEQDFQNEWNDLIAKPFNINKVPDAEQDVSKNGYEIMGAAESFEFNGKTVIAILYVYSGQGKVSSTVAITSSTDYMNDIENFISQITPIAFKNNNSNTENKEAEKIIETYTSKDLLGEWYLSDGNAKITFLFSSNGKYDKGALVDRRIISNLYENSNIKGKGTYALNGSTLTLTPTSGSKEVYQIRFSTDKNDEGKPMNILHLKRPVVGGQAFESDYYFVPQTEELKKPTTTNISSTNSFALLKGNGITGVWIGYYAQLSSAISGLSWHQKVYFNDGKAVTWLPNKGFFGLPNGNHVPYQNEYMNEDGVGKYVFNNEKGKHFYSMQDPTPATIELIKPNQIKVMGNTYYKCQNVDGLRLSGAYTSYTLDYIDEVKTKPLNDRPVISFTTDGKFTDEGICTYFLTDYTAGANNNPGKGTYFIQDYSIVLKYNDGRTKQFSFTIPFGGSTNNPSMILLQNGQLNKMK
jgi:hypothetical protein